MANYDVPDLGIIKARYEAMQTVRNKYRDRGREYAKLTLPYLMPETDEGTDSSEFQGDYNTEGAKLVNALANKYIETLFPAGRSFVKMDLEPEDMAAQVEAGAKEADILATFAGAERIFRKHFEAGGSRPVLLDALKHLIVTGNALLFQPQDGALQNYAIDEYVVTRDLSGKVLEILTEDKKALIMLPQEIKAAVIAELDIEAEKVAETTVNLYTWIRRSEDDAETWVVDQAVEGFNVGEQNTYKETDMRWLPIYWNRTRREMYGRGLVEEHGGSFWTLSILTEALAQGCVTLADIKFLVRPGSLTDVAGLNAAASGSYHYGEPDDISAISTDRSRDIVMIKDVIEIYKRHLGEVFMYLPSTMRDAERVTAEENRLRARELENAHGGVYSVLSQTLQRPLAMMMLNELGMGNLETQGVNVQITTGLDALSRGNENDKINHWISDLANTANVPEDARGRFMMSEFMKTTAAGRDVDFTNFIMSDADFEAKVAQQQQQEAQIQAEAAAVQQGGGLPQ